jgi:hypothetical protein
VRFVARRAASFVGGGSRTELAECEHTFVRLFSFTVTEHDPDRPWMVIGVQRQVAELADDVDFFGWAAERRRVRQEPRRTDRILRAALGRRDQRA